MKAALYARYSTEKQSEDSIADQFRVCEGIAERHGLKVVAHFSDAAISGGTTERPGYQDLLEAARRGEFAVIVAEDTSRLWRNLGEQAPRINELLDLGVHVVTHDLDTRSESAGVLGAVNGAMSEQYRKEIGRRTRRGLEGRARAGKSAGGRAYGYVSASKSSTGQLEIEPVQAATVLRIYEYYEAGNSARAIAAILNAEGVPSPGSTWNRVSRRKRGWVGSAIAGDPARGIGILNNELYVGRLIWNRLNWVRSAADSSKRRCVQIPRDQWIVNEEERLRIVPQELWARVKARQRGQTQLIGNRIRQGFADSPMARSGRKPKYLFSSLLVCGECGAKFVMADRRHYACSSRVNGGPTACSNDVRVPRSVVEAGLLAGIQQQLLSPEEMQKATRTALRLMQEQEKRPRADKQAIARLEAEVANLVDAIASGALKQSPALAERLAGSEHELSRLQSEQRPTGQTAKILKHAPRLADEYRRMIAELPEVLGDSRYVDRARAELRKLLGEVRIMATPEEIRFETTEGRMEAALLRAAGGTANNVVAGAGFCMYLAEIPRR